AALYPYLETRLSKTISTEFSMVVQKLVCSRNLDFFAVRSLSAVRPIATNTTNAHMLSHFC
ncbi:MAG: hypothetical protein WBA17_12585, partial [Saprospiraceae bacterium]